MPSLQGYDHAGKAEVNTHSLGDVDRHAKLCAMIHDSWVYTLWVGYHGHGVSACRDSFLPIRAFRGSGTRAKAGVGGSLSSNSTSPAVSRNALDGTRTTCGTFQPDVYLGPFLISPALPSLGLTRMEACSPDCFMSSFLPNLQWRLQCATNASCLSVGSRTSLS